MAQQIQLRRDTATNWNTVNPILAEGELGLDLTNHQTRTGNGVDHWADLPVAAFHSHANLSVLNGITDVIKACLQFTRSGNLNAGTFLQNGAIITSTTTGAMVCRTCQLSGAAVMNTNTISDSSGIDILKNGVSVATLNITSGRSAFTSALSVGFNAGDFISIRTKTTNGSNLRDVQVTVDFK